LRDAQKTDLGSLVEMSLVAAPSLLLRTGINPGCVVYCQAVLLRLGPHGVLAAAPKRVMRTAGAQW
jgi:hypothetical protein